MLLDPFRNLTYIREQSIYGFGPWVVRENYPGEPTWNNVVQDWTDKFNQLIIDYVLDRKVVVQAGSWQGVYPLLLSNMFEKVYTFEPNPINFFCTTMNCQRNNVLKFQAALSDRAGVSVFEETSLTGQGRLDSAGSYQMPVIDRYEVAKIRLDDLNLASCDFLFLDVENHEYQSLYGGMWTIKKHRPVILLERNFNDVDNQRINSFLESLDYRLKENIDDKDFLYLHHSHPKF